MKAELIVDAPIIGQKKIWVKQIEKKHFDHPFHFHKLCELTWVKTGTGKLVIGDYIGTFSKNELILCSPDLPHLWKCDPEFYDETSQFRTSAVGLYFPIEFISGITDEESTVKPYIQMMQKAERGLRFFGDTKNRVIEDLSRLINSTGIAQLGQFFEAIGILAQSEECVQLTSISYKSSASKFEMNRFNDVYQYLFEHFHRDITLQEISNLCNMTPNAFCRFFKQKTQKTFIQFLHEIRIGHAKKLLQNKNLEIKDICYECGYNNPVNFFHFFKKNTGSTPNEYRKKFTENI